jgi:uroporphyrinogen-III synthase
MINTVLLRSSPSSSCDNLSNALNAKAVNYKNIFCYQILTNIEILNQAKQQISNYDNIIFTSPISTDIFCQYLHNIEANLPEQLMLNKNIFAVGKTTANTIINNLPNLAHQVFFPNIGSGIEDLNAYISNVFKLKIGSKIAVIQGGQLQYDINPYDTKNFICYNKVDVFSDNKDLLRYFTNCSFLVIFSNNIAEIFANYIFTHVNNKLRSIYLAKPIMAIHNNIATVLLKHGFTNVMIPKHAHQDYIIEAIVNWR